MIVVAAAAGYLVAGWAGLSVAVTAGTAVAMVVLRYLLPTLTPDEARKAREKPQARPLSGYSHRRYVVRTSIASKGFYQGELRPVLEHLLAARLAERHGVHLYQDPDAARRLLCRHPRDADLWAWIDPAPGRRPPARKAGTERGHPEAHPGAPHRPIGETVMGTVETAGTCTAILDELERAVVGRRRTLELVLIGILAGGHVLLEDLPGLGKTLIARSFARVLGLDFARIQFTPDLLPSDVTGARCTTSGRPRWCSGPGRCSPSCCWPTRSTGRRRRPRRRCSRPWARARSAWTGRPASCPPPFIVLATDNPIEYEGTYELPEAQLDRFLMRLRLGYLSSGDETAMLRRRVDRAREQVELHPVTSAEGVLAMRDSLEQVEISPDLLDYIVAIVSATRHDAQVQVGASPRGGLALVQLARGQAVLNQRDYVIPDDIKQVAVPALAHRVTLRPELWVHQVSADDVVARMLAAVPTPKTDPSPRTAPASGRDQAPAAAS